MVQTHLSSLRPPFPSMAYGWKEKVSIRPAGAPQKHSSVTYMDLSRCATEVRVVVECLPEVVNTPLAGLGPGIEQADDIRVQVAPDRVEEPAVRVDLLGVLLLQAEDHLHRDEVVRITRMRLDQRRLRRHRQRRGVLEDVSWTTAATALSVCLHTLWQLEEDSPTVSLPSTDFCMMPSW